MRNMGSRGLLFGLEKSSSYRKSNKSFSVPDFIWLPDFYSAYIHCPGSYLCDKVPDVNISKCVTLEEVCDGEVGCPGGDDETLCGR